MNPGEPLRIWHVNLAPGMGTVDGVLTASVRLAVAQAAAGHDVRLLLVDSSAGEAVRGPLGGGDLLESSPTVSAALDRAASLLDDPTTRPDIVHLHSVFRPAHARLAATLTRAGVPYVTAPHSGLSGPSLRRYPVRKAVYGRLVERRLLRRAASVACLTATEVADARRYARRPELSTSVAPNGLRGDVFDAPRWRPDTVVGRERPRVVTLARYDVRQKGLDVLADIARRCPGIDFAVYGEADRNEPGRTNRLIGAAPSNLAFRPPVHGPEKFAELAGATMFVQPSRWEGFSVALAEALAVGVPCAVSRYVGDSLDVAGRGLGLVLDADVDVAADQVAAAVTDVERLRAWSSAATAYARAELDEDAVAARHLARYHQVLGRRPAPR